MDTRAQSYLDRIRSAIDTARNNGVPDDAISATVDEALAAEVRLTDARTAAADLLSQIAQRRPALAAVAVPRAS